MKNLSDELTETIIGCAYTVANTIGNGFLEKVYENALAHELTKRGLRIEQQRPIPVYYDQGKVGEYLADMIVEGSVLTLCLLINFGTPKLQIKRIVNNHDDVRIEGAGV